MSKIAFFLQHMLSAGVENALLALVEELKKDKNKDITIYVIDDKGAFKNRVPEGVTYKKIPMPDSVRNTLPRAGSKFAINEKLTEHNYYAAAVIALKHIKCRGEFSELQVNFDKIPDLSEQYDIAVNYHMHSPFLVKYLSEKVTAKHKYCFVHNDFTSTGYNIEKLRTYLECFEGFYCVANKLRDEFVHIFPEYKEKTYTALNLVRVDSILNKGNEFYPEEYVRVDEVNQSIRDKSNKVVKLLTVGRLEPQKGYDIAIAVAKKLKDEGHSFIWFVIGSGTEGKTIEKKVVAAGLEEQFKLLGMKDNPYPYFKNCDIYVQTSKHEGYVTTVTEAKIFNRPIVCTDVSGAREQLEDCITGDIAEISIESVYGKLLNQLLNENIRRTYSENLSKVSKYPESEYLSIFGV